MITTQQGLPPGSLRANAVVYLCLTDVIGIGYEYFVLLLYHYQNAHLAGISSVDSYVVICVLC